jgi:hypothetical protein
VGLGHGGGQDYERAGVICRGAGLDPQGRVPNYTLGYACTLAGLSGRTMRMMLTESVFQHSTAPLVVDVSPPRRDVTIVSAPPVAKEAESATGSHVRRPVINLQQKLEEAWRAAIKTAPQPDPSRLQEGAVRLSIDVDMALETAMPSERREAEGGGRNALDMVPALQLQIAPSGVRKGGAGG